MKLQIFLAAIIVAPNLISPLSAEENARAKNELVSTSYVRPIDFAALARRHGDLPERDRAIVNLYFEGARRYVLTREDGAFPEKGTEHWRNIAERAHGAAVLGTLSHDWPDDLKKRCRQQSAAFVKEFADQFREEGVVGGNATRRKTEWQVSWWVAEMGAAAWFVWDDLDAAVQKEMADLVVFHADRIAALKPGARVNLDTEAETVAWNSTILSLAANMLPQHPHSARWREAAKQYVYTIFATPHDLQDGTPGDDGRPIKDWVVGANIHDDFTLENHNRFHIDYEYTCYRFMIFGAAMYRLAGNEVPGAFRHHTLDSFEKVLLHCTSGSKFAVFVSDNDWKRYHLWTETPAVDGYIALTESSPLASALEEQSLQEACSYWREFPANFTYANPYVCGKAWTPRIADIVLLHLLLPPLPAPMPAAKVEVQLEGATRKPDINLVTQYSKGGSFRSFYWGPGPTVRHIEAKNNAWMLLPLTADYGVEIDGKLRPDAGAKVVCRNGADWFWVLRRHERGEHEAFVSLPDDIVVMMNSVSGAALQNAKQLDRVVGIEKPHKSLTAYYQGGQATFRYGQKAWDRTDIPIGLELKTSWVNLEDSIGYVSVNQAGGLSGDLAGNSSHITLPLPGRRGSLGLFHLDNPRGDQHFITVAFPNQSHRQTEEMARKVRETSNGGLMTCLVPPYFVWANFSDQPTSVQLPGDTLPATTVTGSSNSVGILRLNDTNKTWTPLD